MAKISGTLTDGAGQIINDCSIELYAKKTTNNVLIQTQAFTVANNGRYSINAQPCEYEVSLIINGFPKKRLGTINVYTDSVDGSLNDYLINPDMSDLTPEFLKQVFDARSEAKNAAIASSQSATNSENSATAAKTSEINAQSSADTAKENATTANNFATAASKSSETANDAASEANTAATNAKVSADNASKSETAASKHAKKALDSAEVAKTSETNAKSSASEAKISADNAKQWASTVDHSNFVKKTGADSQSIEGELKIGSLSANEKINATEILENGNRVYSPNNKPDADIIGALPATRIVDNEISTYSVDDNVDFKKIPTIGGKSVLGTGDYGVGSYTGAQLNNPDDTLPGGCYATRTASFPELTEFQNRNDSASLVVYPAWTKNWCVEKLAVVYSKTPRIYYRCATPEGKQKWHEAITTANINNYLPVGVPLPWPTNQPPAGWLECNGSTFDKNKFPKLAVAYPTGILPDLRGEFIRGWDNARGVDPGRGILSWQGDAIRNMVGSMGFTELNRGVQTSGAFYVSANPYASMTYHSRGDGFNTVVTFDASRTVPVSHDNHPRNVAFMYIVKAE